ncbi:hypothetical protein M4I21_05200 [Cellulophaga sp. 20_2_10]|uniref:hypothetical protein n=1 Tax=Cellulophaga sp. 20_2_10 TaxID=2942476 RepID=UPI00201AF6CD|nr:hypothetical protein [Cellulophaga sp. 20_2_10]MCL5245195.1 hypothetical protein [Cellulophaga sp. 20_2_10]
MQVIEYNKKRLVEDVKINFKEVIKKYHFSVNQSLAKKIDHSGKTCVYLENSSLIICLNFNDSYSFINITPIFYFKEKPDFIEIKEKQAQSFLKINDNSLTKWISDYNDANNSAYKEGIYEMKLTNDMLIHHYDELLNGTMNKNEYLRFSHKPKKWLILYFTTRLLTAASFIVAISAGKEKLFSAYEDLLIKLIVILLFLSGISYYVYIVMLKKVVEDKFYDKKTIEYLEPVGYINAIVFASFFAYIFNDSNSLNSTAILIILGVFSLYVFCIFKLSQIRKYYSTSVK